MAIQWFRVGRRSIWDIIIRTATNYPTHTHTHAATLNQINQWKPMPTESCSCWKLNSYLSHQNAVVVVYPPPCSGTTTLNSDTYNKSLKTTLNSRISHKYNNKRTTPLIDTFLDRKKTVRLSTTLSLSLSLSLSLCAWLFLLRLFFCHIWFSFSNQ